MGSPEENCGTERLRVGAKHAIHIYRGENPGVPVGSVWEPGLAARLVDSLWALEEIRSILQGIEPGTSMEGDQSPWNVKTRIEAIVNSCLG